MGRPSSCHSCCGGDPPPPPPVTDCEDLLCIVFMDENSPGIPDSKMQGFIDAYPNRVLIVLDVAEGVWGTMTYTTKFNDYNRAFSLHTEWTSSPTNLIEMIERDNGSLSIGITNDPWERIKEILDRNGLTSWLNDDNTEVSVFTDNSGSTTTATVSGTNAKLKLDLEADGKTLTASTYNSSEDIICPFVTSECCGSNPTEVGALAFICGYSWSCPTFENLNFVSIPNLSQGAWPETTYNANAVINGVTTGPYSAGDSIIVDVGTSVEVVYLNHSCLSGSFPSREYWYKSPAGAGNYEVFELRQFGQLPGRISSEPSQSLIVTAGGWDVYPNVGCSWV